MTSVTQNPPLSGCSKEVTACSHGGTVADTAARVIRNDWVNGQYKHLVLAAGSPASSSTAGQFFHLACPATAEDTPFFRRPMSTYRADPQTGEVEFLYKVTGAGTRGLASLEAGDKLDMLGPLGIGFTLEPDWKHIVVLGRGVGLATLAPLSDLAAQQDIKVTAILSARDKANLMSQDRFIKTGADIIEVTDEDDSSDVANVERILRELIAQGRADAFFTCGSNRLMLLMQKLAAEFNIDGQVAMEQQMACGIGMCYCCVRAFREGEKIVSKRVCWDGPVFELKAVTSW
ncbi:MAG: dihydroorotate dehydrogenase electron transfer subunit [Pseudomonadota bacterium]